MLSAHLKGDAVDNYPNWSLIEYLKGAMGFVGYAVGSATGDFWVKLFALFLSVALAGWFIPFSIVWFIIKNKGRVGGLTWALVIITPIIVFLWMALA